MDNEFYKPSYLYQYKPEPVKGSSINTILIFSMADASGCSSYISGSKRSQSIIKIQDLTNKSREGASLLHTRGMWRPFACYHINPKFKRGTGIFKDMRLCFLAKNVCK